MLVLFPSNVLRARSCFGCQHGGQKVLALCCSNAIFSQRCCLELWFCQEPGPQGTLPPHCSGVSVPKHWHAGDEREDTERWFWKDDGLMEAVFQKNVSIVTSPNDYNSVHLLIRFSSGSQSVRVSSSLFEGGAGSCRLSEDTVVGTVRRSPDEADWMQPSSTSCLAAVSATCRGPSTPATPPLMSRLHYS